MSVQMPKNPREWTEGELLACVAAYREMQVAEGQGLKVNKTEKRKQVLNTSLSARSAGSYEFRMANISAVLSDLGLPILKGYQPRRNVGSSVTAKLLPMINQIWQRQDIAEGPTEDPDEFETRVKSAMAKFKSRSALMPPVSNAVVEKCEVKAERFLRNPNVVAWVLLNANGTCEACNCPAPFTRVDGEPYLEVHHVRPLAEGGPDSIDNAIAVCPTCHRRFHFGIDRVTRRKFVLDRIKRLADYPYSQ